MAKVLGNIIIRIDGEACLTVGDSVEFDPGGFTREEKMADNKVNYSEKPRGSRVSCKFLYSERTKLKKINGLTEGQIEICTDTGAIVHTMDNATRFGEPCKVSSGDGTIAFEAMGDPISLQS